MAGGVGAVISRSGKEKSNTIISFSSPLPNEKSEDGLPAPTHTYTIKAARCPLGTLSLNRILKTYDKVELLLPKGLQPFISFTP